MHVVQEKKNSQKKEKKLLNLDPFIQIEISLFTGHYLLVEPQKKFLSSVTTHNKLFMVYTPPGAGFARSQNDQNCFIFYFLLWANGMELKNIAKIRNYFSSNKYPLSISWRALCRHALEKWHT